MLRWMIGFTAGIAILAGLTEWLFSSQLGIPGLQQWLALSSWGLDHQLYYQPFTYFLVQQAMGGISLGFMLSLAFQMLLMHICGSQIEHITGEKGVLKLFLGSAWLSGLVGALLLWFGLPGIVAGAGPAVFALMMVWAMLYPGMQLMLFMMVPITVRWLVVVLLAMQILLPLSVGDLVTPLIYLVGTLTGYAYGVLACDLSGPFPQIWLLDSFLRRFQRKAEVINTFYEKAKVFDIRTGEAIVEDDAFMDAMLDKISKSGRNSLSSREKQRMDEISKKARKT